MRNIERFLGKREVGIPLERVRKDWHMTELEMDFVEVVVGMVKAKYDGVEFETSLVGGRALENPRWLNGKLIERRWKRVNSFRSEIDRVNQLAREIGISRLPFNEELWKEWHSRLSSLEFTDQSLKEFLLRRNPLLFADIDLLMENVNQKKRGRKSTIHWPISDPKGIHTQIIDCFIKI